MSFLPRNSFVGNIFDIFSQEVPYHLEGAPALASHKRCNFPIVPILIIGHQQSFKFRHLTFRDNEQALALGNQIVIRKNDGRSFVPIVEDLGFHTIKAQRNGSIYRVSVLF